jgi:pimeloyl-ACP methyl ester carboxylesterase
MTVSFLHLIQIPALGCNASLYEQITLGSNPGLVTTPHIPTANRYETMVADLLAAAPDQFIALGTSMGGRLALEVTLAAPERVAGLVIIGAGPAAVADQAAGLRRSSRIRNGEFENVVADMAGMISHLPGKNGPATRDAFVAMCRDVGPEIMASQSDALAHRVDRWPQLQHITCPTLLLWGRKDQFSPVEDAMRMHEKIKASQLSIIEDCGHFPTLEYPDQSTTIITQWLSYYFTLTR